MEFFPIIVFIFLFTLIPLCVWGARKKWKGPMLHGMQWGVLGGLFILLIAQWIHFLFFSENTSTGIFFWVFIPWTILLVGETIFLVWWERRKNH